MGAQAAPAAAGRRGRPRRRRAPGRLLHEPGGRERGDHERGDALRRRRRVELQRAARRTQKGTVALNYQSNSYPSGAADPSGDTETEAPCDTATHDARRQGERGGHSASAPSAPRARRSGVGFRRSDDQHARARGAEAGRDPGGNASRRRPRSPLQLRLRDVRQRGERRRPRHCAADESGHERCQPALEHDGSGLGDDPVGACRRPDPARRRRQPGCRLRHALHRVLRHRLHQRRRPHPRLEHRHRADGPQRLAAPRLVRSRRVLRDGRLQRRHPGRGRPRRDISAHRHRRHRRRLGERRRRGPLLACAGRYLGARHLDARPPACRSRSAARTRSS